MDPSTDLFLQLQPRLLGVAYRMLGSLAEAEDVVQDVWLGWNAAAPGEILDPEAWLVTTTSRRSIDRLRRARSERERYAGIWLPEPVITAAPATPEELQEASSDLSLAFLTVLERLSPEARAAYLLREVFDADYPDIARVLDKNEAACRQIVHRAKSQLREERPRYVVSAEAHQRLMRRFAEAWSNADLQAMKELMADSASLIGDGGGIVSSFPQPMVGGARVAQLLYACTLRRGHELRLELAWINGRLGLLRYFGDELESAQYYDSDGERITGVYVQRNPDKLRRIAADRLTLLH
ncbi:RNA polymerase sigma-70 factor [Lysobacter silvisoli]|uniref:RNA polymerase sigma-70 factor n=1 Tax=Lysobacter silvisoli TaxID=2293254 RepID=A0A371K061_9GAMM|nr:RNA polymerase sigma-70 factor [Lysobacter silvisoli]RDZ27306.1 RNA polymerase sigma-70 factor [Lysobacter silvisoli]